MLCNKATSKAQIATEVRDTYSSPSSRSRCLVPSDARAFPSARCTSNAGSSRLMAPSTREKRTRCAYPNVRRILPASSGGMACFTLSFMTPYSGIWRARRRRPTVRSPRTLPRRYAKTWVCDDVGGFVWRYRGGIVEVHTRRVRTIPRTHSFHPWKKRFHIPIWYQLVEKVNVYLNGEGGLHFNT